MVGCTFFGPPNHTTSSRIASRSSATSIGRLPLAAAQIVGMRQNGVPPSDRAPPYNIRSEGVFICVAFRLETIPHHAHHRRPARRPSVTAAKGYILLDSCHQRDVPHPAQPPLPLLQEGGGEIGRQRYCQRQAPFARRPAFWAPDNVFIPSAHGASAAPDRLWTDRREAAMCYRPAIGAIAL